jgi:membrane protease YdiL (CAAX protease family)
MENRSRFAQLAALAEILFVLALGNIAGVAIYDVIAGTWPAPDRDGIVAALYAGLRILLRIGLVAAFGLALLRFRRGLTPRDVGLTRANQPLRHLLGVGILLGAFSSFLVALVFAVHAIVPLGEGLPAWDEVRVATRDATFYVEMLATSIIVPPLVEEIMARGYMRVRLVESYGRVGGVVLTGLVFALAHGKFISTDPLLAVFLTVLVISSISWAWITQLTGSLMPAMIAHAITNGFATLVLFDVWAPFAASLAIVLWQRRPILGAIRQFVRDWREEHAMSGLWYGALVLVAALAALMIAMSQFGRLPALAAFGAVALAITAVNLVLEIASSPRSSQ